MNIDPKILKQINKNALAQMQFAKEQVDKVYPNISEIVKQVDSLMNPMKQFIKTHGDHLIKISNLVARTNSEAKALKEKLHRDDIWLTPFFSCMPFAELYQIFCDDPRSVIEVYSDFFNDRKHLDLLLTEWRDCDLLEDRIPILSAILDAHLAGALELSIPVACAQIEGIIRDVFKLTNEKSIKPKLQKLKKALKAKSDHVGERFLLDALLEVVFENTRNIPSELKDVYPNRHGILHGSDVSYYKKKHFSLKLILIIDFLRTYIEEDEVQSS